MALTQVPHTEPLSDPIPAKITKAELAVVAEAFLHMPATADASSNYTNSARARIQYLQPFGNTLGALAINDTRGILYRADTLGLSTYLDLRTLDVGFSDALFPNEMGLAGVAFHPEFTSIGKPGFGKFYTAYSARPDPNMPANYLPRDAYAHVSVIREWSANNPRGRTFAGSSREIFRIGQFAPNHNIGSLGFNPAATAGSADYGMLYIALGDGGAANDPREFGQSLAAPMAAIMRIDPLGGRRQQQAYAIPADNPFVQRADAAPEIWAYGLRHPQHFSWDNAGRMFINDMGQNQIEEVNLGVAGANYGWRRFEGTFGTAFNRKDGEPGRVYAQAVKPAGFTWPIAQYDHDEGRAISSGFVYTGSAITELRGHYVFADLVLGRVFYFDLAQLNAATPPLIRELRLIIDGREQNLLDVSSQADSYGPGLRVDLRLGIDALGELYLLTKSDGWIRKLVPLTAP